MSIEPRITLRAMTDGEYPGYRSWFIEEYARDLSANHGYGIELGRINATASIDGYLPQGSASADNQLYCIEAEVTGEDGDLPREPAMQPFCIEPDKAGGRPRAVVGYLWIGCKTTTAFILDFGILPPWRRRGYGAAALARLDALLRAQGVTELGLRVAQDNPRARALYDKSGFRVTGTNMAKRV